MSTLDIATLALTIIGLNRFAARRTRAFRSAGTNTWWPLLFVVAAIGLRMVLGHAGLIGNLLMVARDLGIGLIAGWLWSWLDRGPAPLWFVSGAALTAAGFLLAPSASGAGMKELLLELGPDDAVAEVESILDAHDATAEKAFPEVELSEDEDLAQYFLVRCPEEKVSALIAALKGDAENVDNAEPNHAVSLGPVISGVMPAAAPELSMVDDPHAGQQWGLRAIKGEAALSRLDDLDPKEVATIAIADTGVDSGHEDLDAIWIESPGGQDAQGHGTHCAGIAGAAANNGLGIASLNFDGRFVRVRGYAALNDSGGGSSETVAQAIIDAAEAGADVISLSLGGYHPTPPMVEVDAVNYALKLGAIVVVAAGNDSEDARNHAPANIPGVIVVTAIDQNGKKADFSNSADSLRQPIAAPGVDIFSLGPSDQYVSKSGTSMATPMVAGLIGIMRSLRPEISATEVYEILKRTGTKGPDAGVAGMTIDADAAIQAVLE